MNAISSAALLALTVTTAAAAQRPARPVLLEAADCNDTQSYFGTDHVAQKTEHATVPLSVGRLEISPGANGGVRLVGGSGQTYSITACASAGAETYEEAQRAVDGVKLTVEGNRVSTTEAGSARSRSVQIIVTAPREANLDVETTNGPVGIDGVEGTVVARAKNGPISVSGGRGGFDVETQNGPVSVRLQGVRWDGELNARTSNGPLSVRVPENYLSGVEISSSSHSPWQCRIANCGGSDDFGRRGRSLRIGSDSVVVKISTNNGPVSVTTDR